MKKIIFYYTCVSAVALFMVFTLLNSVRTNPINLKYDLENDVVFNLFPQGWSFFTKDPRETYLKLYRIDGDKVDIVNFKNTQLHNLYGLIKSDRVYYYNIFGEMSHIPSNHFFNSRETVDKVDLNKLNRYKITNSKYQKGAYVAQIQELTPWIWHSELEKVAMPCRYIILNVQ